MGKSFHEKEELFSKLFFNILKKYKNRIIILCIMDLPVTKRTSLSKEGRNNQNFQKNQLSSSFIPHASLVFQVSDKYEGPINLCWIKDLFWEERKGEKVEFG